MGWETRRGRRYYYRARKVGGRVVKAYVGAGPGAEAAAARDARVRDERRAATPAARAERTRLAAADTAADAAHEAVDALLGATLVLAGYHRPRRGAWRRRRDG